MNRVSVSSDLPTNPNWARRIQDIKELGYTLATHTNFPGQEGTCLQLLPIPRKAARGYEMISSKTKNRIIKLLNRFNVYENKATNPHALIPDHKFPEIRWDADTKETNEEASDFDLINKFQLLDNQGNLQKREICRSCYQTGRRGTAFGIAYFYHGNSRWPSEVPKVGREAEAGCKGCAWYDMQKWRESLNSLLGSENKIGNQSS